MLMASALGPRKKRGSNKQTGSGLKYSKMKIAERRIKLMELYEQRYSYTEMAKILEVDRSQVVRDLQAIEAKLVERTQEAMGNLEAMRLRELEDLDRMERICIERLEKLQHSPHQGSRWLEERRKIKERRAKLMGLDSEQKFKVTTVEQEGTKEQRDAAVQAALKAAQITKELKLDEESDTVGSA